MMSEAQDRNAEKTRKLLAHPPELRIRCSNFPTLLRHPVAVTALILLCGNNSGCNKEFDSVPEVMLAAVPVVICDAQTTPLACSAESDELAWVFHSSNEGTGEVKGTVPDEAQSLDSGCQFAGTLHVRAVNATGQFRILALDEDQWVAQCAPEENFPLDDDGVPVINDTFVFSRGIEGCELLTTNFCD